jgi:hypothetical protein
VISRNTNRRHMNRDHDGRSAARATLLVRAVDAILGTHSSRASETLWKDRAKRLATCLGSA